MNNSLSIKMWAEDDRPREKMLLKGKNALSDAELIAIILGSGTSKMSALDVGQEVLRKSNNDLYELGRLSINQLKEIKGIGDAKAVTLTAAMELGRRRIKSEPKEKPKITCSKDAYTLLYADLIDLNHEEFHVIFLTRSNHVIQKKRISIGGMHGTVADGKLIFKEALLLNASGIILAHNHPSGNPKPSPQDESLTKQFIAFGKLIDINVLDHIIFTGQTYVSFADEGIL